MYKVAEFIVVEMFRPMKAISLLLFCKIYLLTGLVKHLQAYYQGEIYPLFTL